MQTSVLIGPDAEKGFIAISHDYMVRAVGATHGEAIEQIKTLIAERIEKGFRLVSICIPPYTHPAEGFFGTLPDDEITREWMAIMAERRRLDDLDENVL